MARQKSDTVFSDSDSANNSGDHTLISTTYIASDDDSETGTKADGNKASSFTSKSKQIREEATMEESRTKASTLESGKSIIKHNPNNKKNSSVSNSVSNGVKNSSSSSKLRLGKLKRRQARPKKDLNSDFIDFIDVLEMSFDDERDLIEQFFNPQECQFNSDTRILSILFNTNGYTCAIDIYCPLHYPGGDNDSNNNDSNNDKIGCHCEKLACSSLSFNECKLLAIKCDIICKNRKEKKSNCLISVLAYIEQQLSNRKTIEKTSNNNNKQQHHIHSIISDLSYDRLKNKTREAVCNASKKSQYRAEQHYQNKKRQKLNNNSNRPSYTNIHNNNNNNNNNSNSHSNNSSDEEKINGDYDNTLMCPPLARVVWAPNNNLIFFNNFCNKHLQFSCDTFFFFC